MSKLFYPKLAAANLRKNARTYIPYILTCICAIGMFYIMYSLYENPATGNGSLAMVMSMGINVIAIFSVIFLFYTNSFLIKRRKKEFGLFNILGMEKKHIARIVALETLYVFAISIVLGLVFGVLFSKLVHLVLLHMLQFDFRYGIIVSQKGIVSSLVLFGCIFIAMLAWSIFQIGFARPVELLRGGQVGEKEPKAKWLIALLGLVCLGAGYWISVTTEDPLQVLLLFFGAVILVIIGTYLLFTAGGVVFLKLLRKNKGYYYKSNHFISVSGMMYRMKQNAAGLATICILSTMVLVMVSSTAALYFGMEDALLARYPDEIAVYMTIYDEAAAAGLDELRDETLAARGIEDASAVRYRYLPLFARLEDWGYIVDGIYKTDGSMKNFCVIPMSDFTALTDIYADLAEDELLVYGNREDYGRDTLTIAGMTFNVTENFGEFDGFNINGSYNSDTVSTIYAVTRDAGVIESLSHAVEGADSEVSAIMRYHMGFDFDAGSEQNRAVYADFTAGLNDIDGFNGYAESRSANRSEFLELYGGLFFLGLFLGLLFIVATVLIIYYKQISEGYDDKERFSIMQKVGLSKKEARRAIRSQILTMFFLPLAAACLHTFFAFPAITRLLAILNLTNVTLFMVTTALSIGVFAVFYVVTYSLTAKAYYRIVGQ